MDIGIIGLPRSGKTTLFNAVTKGKINVATYSNKPNVGVTKVPDDRLQVLEKMYNPRKVIHAEVTYTEVPPPPEGFGKTRGIGGEYLNALQSSDALLIVLRSFDEPSVAHIDETVDAGRDLQNMLMELMFSDIGIVERRLSRIESGFKAVKSQEKELLVREQHLLEKLKSKLEEGILLRDQQVTSDELIQLSGFGFLSMKPIIAVINLGEDQLVDSATFELAIAAETNIRVTSVCAQLEMELTQMEPIDEDEFRQSLGILESGLNKMIKVSYEVVDQIAFFTVGEDEVRAWEIKRHTIAQKAAGKIHSDLERGFIRAEVITYSDLISSGSLSEGRKRGVLRQEGKEYVVQDGDIMQILFNI